LHPENFKTVQQRLTDSGMRTGFACIFYGAPGTGKTETVYQLARATGRDLMLVNIAETKSCWFGESEKKIKEVFDNYRNLVKNSEVAPILLFNEADAVIGKRKDVGNVGNSSVAQTENAIQNIILQEMENLEGIMIATTNLTENLDKAFERRFLYKIEFEKPSINAKRSIWQTMIPELGESEATELAQTYNFSGGQIENITRKRAVDNIISGAALSLEAMHTHCRNEQLNKAGQKRKVGF
jgi:SpoVK/Ycf46/Vps4 family AAA+-type ATPase